MEEPLILQLIQNLVGRFEYLRSNQFNLDEELRLLIHPITREPLTLEMLNVIERGFLERINYRRSYDDAILTPVSVVSDPRDHEEWYDQWLAENDNLIGSYYWKRLENYLSIELTRKYGPNNAGRIVRSIDKATYSIMQKIANPQRQEFSFKGLVVGYVQSGKTANFTALISKATDAGYKLIIVLSGIHTILRRQTQLRLDKELTGMNDLRINEYFISEPSDVKRWNRITTSQIRERRTARGELRIKDLGEFDTINKDPFDSICNRSTPTIGIIKKNVRVLDKLIEYISQSHEVNRRNIPVLIVDDEADQASIDTNANNPDLDPTSINERIRTILRLFPRRTYIGYTATPFANVLIDMGSRHNDLGDDLYPRNFIVSLPEPENYFGASTIFQGDLANRFVVEIHDDSALLIQGGRITTNLSSAIDQFIISCAIRNLRGDRMKPMSMLVHISHRIIDMEAIYDIVEEYLTAVKGRYRNQSHKNELRVQFENEWNSFYDNMISINQTLPSIHLVPEFEVMWDEIESVLDIIQPLLLNSSSEDRLDYSTGEEIKLIAVGGNQLSRGLTLEGLMTSYYLRVNQSIAYDTLLQMGRWFGYRQGYEDLTRIHTTEQIWNYFEHLSLVESELRGEIYRYEEEEMTPAQMAVAIRGHRTLNVTARNKMGAARSRQTSYSGSLNQTIWFALDRPEVIRANFNLGESFIVRINQNYGFSNVNNSGVYLANSTIDGSTVLQDFLRRYNFASREHTGGPGLDSEGLLDYISRRMNHPSPELTNWSVALVGNATSTADSDPINYGGLYINRIQRSRRYTERGYNIGVLTEPDHLSIDLRNQNTRSPQNPLLLLYLIWKDSRARIQVPQPQIRPGQRIDLYRFLDVERIDILGLAIVLPESNYEPNNYIGQ